MVRNPLGRKTSSSFVHPWSKRKNFAAISLLVAAYCVFGGHAAQASAQDSAAGESAESKATPRLPDGHPDLNGYWDTGAQSNITVTKQGNTVRAELDLGATPRPANAPQPARREPPSTPSYKPKFAGKVKDLAKNSTSTDSAFFCKPLGVPRIGPPHQIVQTSKMVVFFYQQDSGSGAAGGIAVRLIPIDAQHQADADPSYFGDSVGHWEGNTLVVDVTNFNDDTWMGNGGFFHTTGLHVIERVSREGDTLIYQATAEDSNVLTKPWVLNPRRLKLSSGIVEETPPCDERDASHLQK